MENTAVIKHIHPEPYSTNTWASQRGQHIRLGKAAAEDKVATFPDLFVMEDDEEVLAFAETHLPVETPTFLDAVEVSVPQEDEDTDEDEEEDEVPFAPVPEEELEVAPEAEDEDEDEDEAPVAPEAEDEEAPAPVPAPVVGRGGRRRNG